MMACDICLVCLNSLTRSQAWVDIDTIDGGQSQSSLYKCFLKFVNNYFTISTVALSTNANTAKNSFCDTCENGIRNICEIYLEFLAVELRLSFKLGELERLLESSRSVESNKLRLMLSIESLVGQLGVKGQVSHIYELRSLLATKCKNQQKKYLPEVIINRNDSLLNTRKSNNSSQNHYENDDDDHAAGEAILEHDPESLDTDELKEHSSTENSSCSQTIGKKYKIIIKEEVLEEDNDETEKDVTNTVETESEHEVEFGNAEDSDPDWGIEKVKPQPKAKKRKQSVKQKLCKVSVRKRRKKIVVNEQDDEASLRSVGRWKCDLCGKITPIDRRAKHVRFHESKLTSKKKQDIRCCFCWMSFVMPLSLKAHMQRIHPKRIKGAFSCEIEECDQVFDTNLELNSHLESHSDSILTCKTCEWGFIDENLLELHQLIHIESVKTPNCRIHSKRRICPVANCNLEFDHITGLQRHYNIQHGVRLKNAKCSKCEHVATSSSTLAQHVRLKHDNILPKDNGPLKCTKCGVICKNLGLLSYHRREFHSKTDCTICGETLDGQKFLVDHVNELHKDAKEWNHCCPNCSKKFPTIFKLTRHIRNSHAERRHKCTICRKGFIKKKDLETHKVNFHSATIGDKHKCPKCERLFNKRGSLKWHLSKCDPDFKFHQNAGEFLCADCGRSFSRQYHLDRHVGNCQKAARLSQKRK